MNVNLSSDSEFLNKLSRVVEANLADENFGVKELAQKTRLSRTQLHRKLKSINNQSVSQFIREVRLNKAKEMLQQDIGTVSEIAYKVGFGSPSYFIKCFHEFFGYPPGVVLKIPSENIDRVSNKEVSDQNKREDLLKFKKTARGTRVKIFGELILLLTVVTVTVFLYRSVIKHRELKRKNSSLTEKSIAVLPLKNVTNNVDIQHLADGIMEDILNRLSHVQQLKVKSRISSEQYRNPGISLPEIAKEMDVSYVLEGSILNNGEKVRIYVQLIDATHDVHVWSDEYNEDLTDIFSFISNVSKNVADELQVALTLEDLESIGKNYTDNQEAYNLYLLGKYFWHQRTKEDLLKSIKYFNQAIELDSSYSLAYAGLADTYNSLSWYKWYPRDVGIQKCKEYALKAIQIDHNLAEAHAALGDCALDFLWDWDLAEKELKLAIKLNPNYALAHKYYADYLDIFGKNDEARIHLNKALELNPESLPIYQSSADCYYNSGNFDLALKDFDKVIEFQNNDSWPYFMKFKIYIHQGKDSEALTALQRFLEIDSNGKSYKEALDEEYSRNGINGIIHWLIEHLEQKSKIDYLNQYHIATLYVLVNNKDLALDHLEYQNTTEDKLELPEIYNDFDLKALASNPRFAALLQKMNLNNN